VTPRAALSLSSTVAVALLSPRSISEMLDLLTPLRSARSGEREALGVAQFAQAVGDELVDVHAIQYSRIFIIL
jgi:hypothetical protein